jgi:streptomycin 6-kinase
VAGSIAAELLRSAAEPVVLHGDLHHDNVIVRARPPGHVAIDPKGLRGDPTFELACFLRNPVEHHEGAFGAVSRFDRRVAILSEMLGDPRERIRSWAFVGAVVSAAWSASADEDAGPWLAAADAASARL